MQNISYILLKKLSLLSKATALPTKMPLRKELFGPVNCDVTLQCTDLRLKTFYGGCHVNDVTCVDVTNTEKNYFNTQCEFHLEERNSDM